MKTPHDLFRAVKDLDKRGESGAALDLLRDHLRRGNLDPTGIEKAGRFLGKALADGRSDVKPLRVLLLGQVTTSWLVPALTAVAWGHNAALSVTEGGYDTVLQDLANFPTGEGIQAPDVVVLLPWNRRLLGGQGAPEARVEDELGFWSRAWEAVGARLGSRLLQVGYDWVTPGPLGHHLSGRPDGPIGLVGAMNGALRRALPADAFFLDLGQVSGTIGRNSFYDLRRYHWTKQVFSEGGACQLAEHLWAGIRALTTGPKKVLVLDLDNTLWGGVVGEAGPLGIALGEGADGEAFRAFQDHVKGLADRGVVLAIASKNNPRDVEEVFEKNAEMALKLDDFGAIEIGWDPKGTTLARLARTLNLGIDSLVFFDDNPAEREQVRQALPEVEVVEVPEEPAEYVRALQAGLYFETTGLNEADRERAAQYAVERKRQALEKSAGSMEEYLRSLEMRAEVRTIDEDDLPRVVQLLAKTNQFNLTTRRHTRQALLGLLDDPRSIGLTLRLADRFGDHGLVAVLVAAPVDSGGSTLRIDTWLMSCRVIGRTAEQFLFGLVLARARLLGYRRLLGEYIPTRKNVPVAELYDQLGFRRLDEPGEDGAIRYGLDLDGAASPESFVVLARDEG
jgi:FkbH-like protein